MRTTRYARLLAVLCAAGCRGMASGDRAASLDPAHAAAIRDSARTFADNVARGVTSRGPAAWRGYFADDPAFFMAAEGRMAFPNSAVAARAIDGLTHIITHIELQWTDSVRVDPLAPGLALLAMPYHEVRVDSAGRRADENGFFTGVAEHRAQGWQFRNAHWSVAQAPVDSARVP